MAAYGCKFSARGAIRNGKRARLRRSTCFVGVSDSPVTVLGLMPVNEFNSAMGWGYDPSYYFAIDSVFGGAAALARLVDSAHASGRGVTLDVVYNHSLGSSLMQIAPDVYRNGDYDGDRMNCGHPMVLEFLRQAVVYLFRTFNLDGFRFDDTKTIVADCVGGWQFLGAIRGALRGAAAADGRAWPYCVAENSSLNAWNVIGGIVRLRPSSRISQADPKLPRHYQQFCS
jgi:pullulanase/glycogen debranching enzyme